MRFVILQHELPAGHPRAGVHYDLMVEQQGRLLTWALSETPRRGAELPAEQLPDHRLEYLDYEGPVSADRGHVTRWDRGPVRLRELREDRLEAELRGERIEGTIVLVRHGGTWTASLRGLEES